MKISFLLLAAAMGLQGAVALAQGAPGAAGGNNVIPEKDRSLPRAEPGNGEPLSTGRSLSDKLDASGGVIKPKPGIDPGIVQPAPAVPNPDSMPVIPPPGTPGGRPGPEPK